MTIFQSFRSTVNGYVRGERAGGYYVLEDPITGAPVGLQSPRGNGPQGIWTPTDLTAAQIASPTAAMIADLNAVYRLNVAPYTRYYSDGTGLVSTVAFDGGQISQPVTIGPVAGDTMLNVTKGLGAYVNDNVMRLQNLNLTEVAATKYWDPNSKERGAIGYGPEDSSASSSAFYRRMFIEIGNINAAGDTAGTGFILRNTHIAATTVLPGQSYNILQVDEDGSIYWRMPTLDASNGGLIMSYVDPATMFQSWGSTNGAGLAKRTPRTWVDSPNISTGTWASSLAVASIDAGPSNDGTTYGGYAYVRAAATAVTGASAPQFGVLEALTIGGGVAAPYTGRVQVGRVTTDGVGIVANDVTGAMWFGGQWGTGASFDPTKIVYSASVHGFAGATWTAAAAASSGIAFRVGIAGQVFSDVANAGTLAMQIQPTTGFVGLGQTDYNNANVPARLTLSIATGGGLAIRLPGVQYASMGIDQANTSVVLGSETTYSLDFRTGVTAGDVTTGTSRFQVTTTRSIIKGIPNIAAQATPASAAAAGTLGDWANDTGFIYICTAANTWKRVAIASW